MKTHAHDWIDREIYESSEMGDDFIVLEIICSYPDCPGRKLVTLKRGGFE